MSGDLVTPPQQIAADGYVTEIPYVTAYQRALNPSLLALTLNVRGMSAWMRGTPMTYLELGCGYGLSTLIHAATNPQATFIGVDFLPEHVATAREMAHAAGLKNIAFIEGSFARWSDMNLPPCDFITMHGVWSWVSAANRAHILQCVDKHLKPGGAVYVSYNALPGHAAMLPIRELMMMEFTRAQGTVPQRIAAAIALVDEVKSVGGGFFADNPLAAHRFEQMKGLAPNYLAHEYFNSDWQAFHFREVANSFGALGLQFAAHADLFVNIDDVHFPPSARMDIARLTDPTLAETYRDFALDRQFRADLYVRPSAAPPNGARQLADTRFFATLPPERANLIKMTTALGEVAPPRDKIAQALAALWDRPLSAREASQHPAFAGIAPQKLMNFLIFSMAAFAVVEPAFPDDGNAARVESARRFNRVIWEKNVSQPWTEANASPVTGGSVEVSREDQMYFLARAKNVDPVAFAAKVLGASEADIRERYRAFEAERRPSYERYGIGS
jgi:SAM-dependent methyltransferase